MIGLVSNFKHPDYSQAAVRRAGKVAQDEALEFYREKYMPLHFLSNARLRYGKAYAKKGRNVSSQRRKRSAEKRRAVNVGQKNIDRGNKLPLVKTGVLRLKMLRGGTKAMGRYDKRKLKFSPPFYLFISRPNGIDKFKALSAVTDKEREKVAEHAQKVFMNELKSKTVRKRG